MGIIKTLYERFARLRLKRKFESYLQRERQQAELKLQQQWHWGDTGARELAVIRTVATWLLPLPADIDAVSWFNKLEQAFSLQLTGLKDSDPDGYAIATSKALAESVLAAISEYGQCQAGFQQALGQQLLKAIIRGDRPRISLLIAAGADVNVTDKFGRDALTLAKHCDELYAQEALLGPQALQLASEASWAVALRHGVYRFTQLPPERISDKLCDEALLGDRHNFYSLPVGYTALANLAKRCSARPMLIAQLPAEVAFNPEFYQQVRCVTPSHYWPVSQADAQWLDYWLEQDIEIYRSLNDEQKTWSRSQRFVKRFARHYGFDDVPPPLQIEPLYDAYLEHEWELEHLPAACISAVRIAKARDNYIKACKQKQIAARLSEFSFAQFATLGISSELAHYAALANYQILAQLDGSLISDELLQQILSQRSEWLSFELGFISSCVSHEQWQRVTAITPIQIHLQPGEFEA